MIKRENQKAREYVSYLMRRLCLDGNHILIRDEPTKITIRGKSENGAEMYCSLEFDYYTGLMTDIKIFKEDI